MTNNLLATDCDKLLTKLIQEENKYDNNINSAFVVKDNYINMIDKDYNAIYTAIVDNKVVGYIFGYLKNQAGNFVFNSTALIESLYVDENYRHQGIASKLLETFYAWCKEQGIKIVEISVFKDNKKALSLYEHSGFVTHTFRMRNKLK